MAGDIIRAVRKRAEPVCTAVLGGWLLALGGCHGDANAPPPPSQAKPQAASPVTAKKGPTAAQLTAGMVEAAAQGKSAAPVSLKFELGQRPKVGQALEINVALIPEVDGSPLSLQITSADGFDLGSVNRPYELPSVEAGEVYRHTLRVVPTSEGVLIVGLTVSLKHEEVTDSKGFSIPIIADR